MATSTTNIGLTKPAATDVTLIREDFNNNMDIIDGRFSSAYMAVQAKASVSITGGSITGITDLAVADGGTGSSTAANARVALGLAIGTNVQAYDATLLSIAALGTAANKMLYTTDVDTWAETALTAFGRSILDDADEATFKATVNLEIGTDVQAYDAQLADIAALAVTNGNIIVGDGTNWVAESGATARTSLGAAASGANNDITSLTGLTTPLAANYGGTGVANNAASTLTISGNFTTTLTVTDTTSVTLPTSGTLINSAVVTLSSLTSIGTITTGGLGTGAVIGGVTMTLGSDADGDIYYRSGGVLTRLAKGTEGHYLKQGASIPEWAAGASGYTNLTEFIGQTAWRLFYSNTDGDVIELAFGDSGTYLNSNGIAAAPTWSVPAGAGDVSKVGTPVDSQVGVWTGDGTIEGAASFTYDGANLQLTGDIGSTGTRITKGWFTNLEITNAPTINGSALSSDNLSDVASIGMLDENETVTGDWTFTGYLLNYFNVFSSTDTADAAPQSSYLRERDGDPTSVVQSGDYLGKIGFYGYGDDYHEGAVIRAIVDGTAGAGDMPTRLEFLTTPDAAATSVLRYTIDNAGNHKFGDGTWTNYINITNAGVLTPEGSATVEATDLVPQAEIDMGANSIGFTLQTATGDGTTTVDWKLGNHVKFTFGAQAETFTFTAPTNPCNITMIMVQDGVGGRDATWPASVKWLGAEPIWTDGGASKGMVIGWIYDGTNYWGTATDWEI